MLGSISLKANTFPFDMRVQRNMVVLRYLLKKSTAFAFVYVMALLQGKGMNHFSCHNIFDYKC